MLGIATGNCYGFFKKDQNRILRLLQPICEKHSIHAIELTYGRMSEFKIAMDKEIISWLSIMDWVSLHYPFGSVANDAITHTCLGWIRDIADQVDIRAVVMHASQLTDATLITKFSQCYDLPIVMELEKPEKFPLDRFIALLDSQPELRFVFDTSHADFHPRERMEALIEHHGHRLSHCHIGTSHETESHLQFSRFGISSMLRLVQDLQVPKVIEESFASRDIDDIEAEVEFLSSIDDRKIASP